MRLSKNFLIETRVGIMNQIYLWPAVKLVYFPEINMFGCHVNFLNVEILFGRFPEEIMDMFYHRKGGTDDET